MGFEGRPSYLVQFKIDTVAPVIDLTAPKDGEEIDTDFIHIEGKTKPEAALKEKP